jgi:hypothetical protein
MNDANLTVSPARVTVTSPNTTVTWTRGSTRTVSWSHNIGAGRPVRIELARHGVFWDVLLATATNQTNTTGTASVVVPSSLLSGPYRLRVITDGEPSVQDQGDAWVNVN